MIAAVEPKPSAPVSVQASDSERKFVLLFCLLAGLHAFIFSAAFPTFNINDEDSHYDLVIKYSHGDVPRGMENPTDEWLRYYALYGTAEYFVRPESMRGGVYPPPLWTLPPDKIERILPRLMATGHQLNHESSQPPLYYLLAGGWWHVGQWLGLHDGRLLYWLRFLDVVLVPLLVWLGYVAARLAFPERKFLHLGVPALIACMPQTVFYSVTNDILSPICFGLVFICLLRWRESAPPGPRLGILLGLALAATFLTKMANLPLLAVAGLFLLVDCGRLAKTGKLRASLPALICTALFAGVPIVWWMFRTRRYFGDFTGSEAKIRLGGWTHKSFAEWFQHPLFTPKGTWIFCHDLLATFWRGEFLWHREPLANPVVDAICVFITLGLLAVALVSVCRRSKPLPGRQTLWFCFLTFLATAAFLGFLSLIYDFHTCYYPSREHPYFTSGRLMLGALIPFLLLFLHGLDVAMNPVKNWLARPLVVAGLMLFLLVAETAVDWPIFFSQYNWFHLGG